MRGDEARQHQPSPGVSSIPTSCFRYFRVFMSKVPARVLLAIICLSSSCSCGSVREPVAGAVPCTSQTHASLEASRARYEQAIARARAWLDGLHVDPMALRRHGLKGKKKLTEQLDGYYRFW